MSLIPDKSVQLVITSPPYWQLKDYGDKDQIGFNDSYEDYINNLNLVWQECNRVLANGCKLCINIGDQFLRILGYGLYGGDYLAKSNHHAHLRRRCHHG